MKIKDNISIYSRFQERLISLDRRVKTLVVVSTDYLLLLISFWLSLSIRDNSFYYPSQESLLLICIGPFIAIPIFYFFGLYRSIIRYSSLLSSLTIGLAVSIYTLLWFVLVILAGIVQKPYDFLVINWLVSIFSIVGI